MPVLFLSPQGSPDASAVSEEEITEARGERREREEGIEVCLFALPIVPWMLSNPQFTSPSPREPRVFVDIS